MAEIIQQPLEYICLLCGNTQKFNGSNAICSRCSSSDRERLIFYYGSTKTDLFLQPITLLHFSPENRLFQVFTEKLRHIDYYPTSFESSGRFIKVDLTDNNIESGSFDVIICSHVLEHIREDDKAISELYRILKVHGLSIIVVPFSDKEPTKVLETPDESGHLRFYGKDFKEQLEKYDFEVEVYYPPKELSEKIGISINNDPLFIAKKVKKIPWLK